MQSHRPQECLLEVTAGMGVASQVGTAPLDRMPTPRNSTACLLANGKGRIRLCRLVFLKGLQVEYQAIVNYLHHCAPKNLSFTLGPSRREAGSRASLCKTFLETNLPFSKCQLFKKESFLFIFGKEMKTPHKHSFFFQRGAQNSSLLFCYSAL